MILLAFIALIDVESTIILKKNINIYKGLFKLPSNSNSSNRYFDGLVESAELKEQLIKL